MVPAHEMARWPGMEGQAQEGPFAWLREVALGLSIREPLKDALTRILSRVAGTLEGTTAAILLYHDEDGDRGGPRRVASVGDVHPGVEEALQGATAWVARTGEPLLLPNLRRVGLTPLASVREASHDVLAVPIAADRGPPCILLVVREPAANPFTERDLAIAATAAAELALVVERERTRRELEDRQDEAKQTELQLQAFALDVRRTFAAEKQRSEELRAALDELQRTYLATVHGLAIAVEGKDELTAGHLVRVTRYARAVLGLVLPGEAADPEYEYGFLLHDIGKLCVPDAILGKRGPLTDEEWVVMKLHPENGRRILEDIPFLQRAKQIVYAHHERWDGKGYPLALRGEDIPLAARFFPVADSYDAMTSDRPYRRAMAPEAALSELRRGSGSQFWDAAVDAFLSLPLDQLELIRQGPPEWTPSGPA